MQARCSKCQQLGPIDDGDLGVHFNPATDAWQHIGKCPDQRHRHVNTFSWHPGDHEQMIRDLRASQNNGRHW